MLRGDPRYFRPLPLDIHADTPIWEHMLLIKFIFHTVADIVGDSLALAREAARIKADAIVLAGVHFMAETARLLNPGKVVLIPDL